jgi:hypothetical protein
MKQTCNVFSTVRKIIFEWIVGAGDKFRGIKTFEKF